jgi:hypothetical protein
VDELLGHAVLRRSLSSSFLERTKRTITMEKRFEALGENFLTAVTLHIVEPPLPSFRLFKAFQWVSYFLLTGVLLIAVGGERAWLSVLEAFGLSSVLQLLISLINTLFSAKGLAALGSYLLLNLFLAFRFYRRYGILLNKSSQKSLVALKEALLKAWSECLDGILHDLGKLREEIREKITMIAEIKASK